MSAGEPTVPEIARLEGLVVMVVRGLKMLGLADRFAPWAALAVSITVAALMALVRFLPASEGVVYHLVAAAVIWLMATGIYHAGRNIKESI
jgi:hypothetical protein